MRCTSIRSTTASPWWTDVTLTVADFRGAQPGFIDPTAYPVTQVQFYLNLGYKLLNASRWDDALDEGVTLFTAHFLALDAMAKKGTGGVPGAAVGVLTEGHVDKVGYSRDVRSVMENDAGHWGMTTFGLVYLRLARMFGAGPIQVGTSTDDFSSLFNGAWPGPFPGFW